VKQLSFAAAQVERYDRDRYMTAVLAPPAYREFLMALYAFNIEIAKTAEIVSEPVLGQIRLQWWRETLDRLYAGESVAHPIAGPLGRAITARGLGRRDLDRLIDARETDLDRSPPPNLPTLTLYAQGVGGALLSLAVQALLDEPTLDPETDQAARLVGTAWALTGLLRAVPFHARQRRLYLPLDLLQAAEVRPHRVFDMTPDSGLPDVVRQVALVSSQLLETAAPLIRTVAAQGRSPLILAELARWHLRDLRRARWNPFVLATRPAAPFRFPALALQAIVKRY
jgi:phytoene synthase